MSPGSLRDTWSYFSPIVSMALAAWGECPSHPLKWHPLPSLWTIGRGGGNVGIQVSLWESSHLVLQHLTPSPGCERGSSGSGAGPQARRLLVVSGRAACEAQLGSMPTASTAFGASLARGNWNLNKQHTWRFGGRASFSLPFTLISDRYFRCEKFHFLSFQMR